MSGRYPCKPAAGLRSCDYGATFAEIAQELGVTQGRVRQLETRALAKAKQILAKRGYTLEDLLEVGHD